MRYTFTGKKSLALVDCIRPHLDADVITTFLPTLINSMFYDNIAA